MKNGVSHLYTTISSPPPHFRRPCYTLLLCELETNDTLEKKTFALPIAQELTILELLVTLKLQN